MNNAELPAGAIEWKRCVVIPDLLYKGKKYLSLAPLLSDSEVGEMRHRFPHVKATARFIVGNVYDFPVNGDSFYFGGAPSFVRAHVNQQQVLEWQTQQRAQKEAQRAKAKELSMEENQLNSYVRPLRDAYRNLPAAGRIPFEVWLLAQLRKP